jgi:tetratricopeptide (TPR) repeat protein
MSSIDRNGPCPCGSGRRYKKCCAWKDAAARAAANRPVTAREAPGGTPVEEEFIAEIKSEVDAELDRLLLRLERGEGESVRARLVSLYEKYPGYHMTNYAMGTYVGLVEDDPVGAIPFFERAVHILPPFAEAHYNLGCSFMKACRVGPAVAAFRKAIRYSSGYDGIAKLAQDRITGLEKIVLKDCAFETLDAYLENERLFDLAFENLRKQRYGEAAEMFGRASKQNPNHVQTHGNLALCLAGLGRKAAALASLDRALELDPAYQPARTNRKVIEAMTEGESFVPGMMAETEYYRECLEAERQAHRPAGI